MSMYFAISPCYPDTNGCITLCLCQYMSPYPPCYPDTTGCITLVFMSIYVAISPVLPRRYRVYHPCVYVNLCHHIPRVIQTLPGVSPLCLCQYMSPYPPCYPDTTGCITLVFMSIYVAISPVLPRRYRMYNPCVYVNIFRHIPVLPEHYRMCHPCLSVCVNIIHHIPRVIQTQSGVSPVCVNIFRHIPVLPGHYRVCHSCLSVCVNITYHIPRVTKTLFE